MIRKLTIRSLSLMLLFFLSNEGKAMEDSPTLTKILQKKEFKFNAEECDLCGEEKHRAPTCPHLIDINNPYYNYSAGTKQRVSDTSAVISNGLGSNFSLTLDEVKSLAQRIEHFLVQLSDQGANDKKRAEIIRLNLTNRFDAAKKEAARRELKEAERVKQQLLEYGIIELPKKAEEPKDEEGQILRYKDEKEYMDKQIANDANKTAFERVIQKYEGHSPNEARYKEAMKQLEVRLAQHIKAAELFIKSHLYN